MMFRSLFLSVVVAAAGLSASAAETTYTLDATKWKAATSITKALDWNTAANWSPATVPNDSEAFACIRHPGAGSSYAFITSAVPVSVRRAGMDGAISSQYPSVFVSDKPLTLCCSGAYTRGLYLYAPVAIPGVIPYFKYVQFCGPVNFSSTAAGVLEDYCQMGFRFDRWANSAASVRANPSGEGRLIVSGATVSFYSPEGSADAVTGSYKLTAGSPYAFRASGSRHTLTVGTAVTSVGALPDGTYLKRVFPDDSIELSHAATNTLAAATLTFAAFAPSVSQSFSEIKVNGTDTMALKLNKYRAEDTLVISTTNFSWAANGRVILATEDGFSPGVLSVCGFYQYEPAPTTNARLQLNTCEIEFVPPNGGATMTERAYMDQADAASVSGMSVPEGKTVTVCHVKTWAGTLVKRGAGTLAVTFESASNGSLQVAAGCLNPTVADGSGSLKSVAVAAGAELVVPAGGLVADAATLEDGAIVSGGTLTVYGARNPGSANVVLRDGGKIVYAYAPDGDGVIREVPTWSTLPDRLRNVAAFWVDANDTSSMTLIERDEKTYVSRINDVRGAGYNFATNVTADLYMPQLLTMRNGTNRRIKFAGNCSGISGETKDITRTDSLLWDRPVYDIRFVFQVLERGNSFGGQYLGTSSRMASHCGDFVRAPSQATPAACMSTPIFNPAACAGVRNGTFRMLDQIWPATKRGFAYVSEQASTLSSSYYKDGYMYAPFVTSLEPAAPYPAADTFDFDYNGTSRFGNKGLCELIVFTNEVSVADRQAITAYLAKKWNKCELAAFSPSNADGTTLGTADATANDLNLVVAADASVMVSNVTGSATLAKDGAGTLYVPEYVNADGKLHVKGGTLEIEAQRLTKDDLPEGIYLHLDASDLSSMTTSVVGETTNVTVWADVRGAGHPKATLVMKNSSQKPQLRGNALNGLPFVDFGEYHYDSTGKYYTPPDNSPCMNFSMTTNGLHSFFAIWGSRNGGGTGFIGCGGSNYNQGMCLTRGGSKFGENPSDPIMRTSSHFPHIGGDYLYGSRFRRNGVESDAATDTFSGTNDLISLVSYVGFGMTALSSNGTVNQYYGGEEIGEYIIYEQALSDANAKLVEAYLRKKWYNADTPGFRAPVAGEVTVDAGATLKLRGKAPLTVSSFKCAGMVDGSVACAASAVLEVTVNDDGSVTPIALTGTLDLSAGATIRLVGATEKLQVGNHTLVQATGITSGALSLEATGVRMSRKLALAAEGNSLVLTVTRLGVAVFVR